MKKKSIIAIVILVALTVSLMTGVFSAFAAEPAAAKGAVYTQTDDGEFTITELKANKPDGYYYTNQRFGYKLPDGETGREVLYATVSAKEDLPADTEDFAALTPTKYTDSKMTLTENMWYVFSEKYEESGETVYSKLFAVYYDKVAPVIDAAELTQYLESKDKGHNFYNVNIGANSELKLPIDWIKDVGILTELTAEKEEIDEETNVAGKVNLQTYFTVNYEYCAPGDYYDSKEWSSSDDDISVKATGYWYFRYSITDLAGNKTVSEPFMRYVIDTDAPVIEFTSSQEKVSTNGTAAGTAYTIPTPTLTDATGSTSYTFRVEKKISGQWVVLYDSSVKDFEIEEKYEDFVTATTVTPGISEISQNDTDYIYRVVYTAKDSLGHTTVRTLDILTTKPDSTADPYQIWKIVLIVIAAVAAVGIIALIFVKPKDKAAEGRVHYGKEDKTDAPVQNKTDGKKKK